MITVSEELGFLGSGETITVNVTAQTDLIILLNETNYGKYANSMVASGEIMRDVFPEAHFTVPEDGIWHLILIKNADRNYNVRIEKTNPTS